MKGKRIFYCELAYVLGILILAFGTALMEKADFGMSMVVAPAYLVYLKLNPIFNFFTFGMGCYIAEGILLIILTIILRRFKLNFIFSFITAVIYGFVVDGFIAFLKLLSLIYLNTGENLVEPLSLFLFLISFLFFNL